MLWFYVWLIRSSAGVCVASWYVRTFVRAPTTYLIYNKYPTVNNLMHRYSSPTPHDMTSHCTASDCFALCSSLELEAV